VIEPTSTLARIYAALDRLEQGTFGLCTQCGDQISLGRLEDDPSIPLCQVCEAYRDL
jgi:RNA polymerase-binding transcription factor DksA